MAKLPTALLPRSLPSTSSTSTTFTCSAIHRPTLLSLSSSSTTTTTTLPTTTSSQQVRHATAVERPKRPFTWTQIIQLSDGSTYTTRSTAPLSVYRSTKDTRNHARWQPSDVSLQNVEVDEAGKLARFRARFGGAFDAVAPVKAATTTTTAATTDTTTTSAAAAAAAAAASAVSSPEGGDATAAAATGTKGQRKKAAVAAIAAEEEAKKAEADKKAAEAASAEEDMFADLMASFVVDQPSLKGGRIAGKDPKGNKKK